MILQLALFYVTTTLATPAEEPAEVDAAPPDAEQATLDPSEELPLEQAIQRYQAFLEAYPDSEQSNAARFRLASLLMTQAEATGDPPAYGAAVEQFDRLLASVEQGDAGAFEQVAEAWYLLGWCLRDLGPERAAQAWQRVVDLAPGSELAASSQLQLGSQAMDQGAWERASTHFEAAGAAQADPATWSQATYMAGWAHYKAQHWDQATSSFAAILAQGADSPLHAEASEYLVLVLVERCEAAGLDVSDELDGALAAVPTDQHAAFLERTAEVLEGMARFDQADAVRKRATQGERKRRPRRSKPQD